MRWNTLLLDRLPVGSDRVLLIVYRYSNIGPVSLLKLLNLKVDKLINFELDVSQFGDSAVILGEFYCRNGQWKFRALAEGSAYGLAALAAE